MPNKPRILIFTGDGKGKTTAALGMALRAVGHGMRVRIIQFIKADASTGEIAAFKNLPGVEISQVGLGFVPPKSSPKFEEHKKAPVDGLGIAREALASGDYDLVILDEICGAVGLGLLDEQEVIDAIEGFGTIIVLTGRGASQKLIDMADTVTEMKQVKHGMDSGWKSQAGVEY